jgi:acetyl esterase/lipase
VLTRTARASAAHRVTVTVTVAVAGLLAVGIIAGGGSAGPDPAQATPGMAGTVQSMRVDRDIRYATISSAQRLDLYRPRSVPAGGERLPLVVAVHGGAWTWGDKDDQRPVVGALVARGYAVAAVNYRLSGEATFPAAAADVKAAVRWLRAHAGEYGVDPGRFGAIGDSAGGHLVALLGTTGGLSLPGEAALGNAGVSAAVQAVVDLYGPVNFATMDEQLRANPRCGRDAATHNRADSPESAFLGRQITKVPDLVRDASPITYVTAARALPPFLIEHGDADCIVPYQQSQELARALTAAGGPAELAILPGAGHGENFPLAGRLPGIVAFFDRALAG